LDCLTTFNLGLLNDAGFIKLTYAAVLGERQVYLAT